MYLRPFNLRLSAAFSWTFLFVLVISSCKKMDTPLSATEQLSESKNQKAQANKRLKDYSVRMLAANNSEYGAEHIITTLKNAWGLAWSTTGTPWISAQAGHVSDITDSIGNRIPAIDPVNIPSPGSLSGGGNPTGVVFNPNSGQFVIPAGNGGAVAAARFIFVGVDGVISAWNPTWGHNSYRVGVNAGSAYTGLTLASSAGSNYLYAANFAMGRIDVWSQNWVAQNWAGAFMDPNLPAGYSPFNIQVVGDRLYVMYAKVDEEEHEEEAGPGLGLVDIYTTSGMFVQRFATGGTLNAPWGIAMAPVSFYKDDEDSDAGTAILVGNFGDGRINAYRAKNGKFLGQLSMHNTPITIEGLWAISFAPPTSPINQNLLYFAAGPNDEEDGVFGYISRVSRDDD
jgi:uncharacterized protein (TIGR03118 family)